MGRPLNKKYFGNRNVGSTSTTADDNIGGEGIETLYYFASQQSGITVLRHFIRADAFKYNLNFSCLSREPDLICGRDRLTLGCECPD